MAKLEIFRSTQVVKDSNTPSFTSLSLPLSLAQQQGAGVNAITKAVGDIKNDLTKIESQNAVDAAKPQIIKDILNVYEQASKADDTDKALTFYYNNTNPKNFQNVLDSQKP